jgi:hypothetical protein
VEPTTHTFHFLVVAVAVQAVAAGTSLLTTQVAQVEVVLVCHLRLMGQTQLVLVVVVADATVVLILRVVAQVAVALEAVVPSWVMDKELLVQQILARAAVEVNMVLLVEKMVVRELLLFATC